MQPGVLHAVGDGEHRYARTRVFIAAGDCQRPEVRWRPDEDDQKQQQGIRIDGVGHCRPTQYGGRGTCRAADHDVLGGRPLQPDRVDDRVADQRNERQYRCQQVDQE